MPVREQFAVRLARKARLPFLQQWLLAPLFRKANLRLQRLFSFDQGRYFIYKVNDFYIPNESLSAPISYESLFEKCRNESLFAYLPQEGETVIDIGAGLGEETLYYSRLTGESGRVFAIEANPAVFNVLKRIVQFNKLDNVRCFNFAIFKENGDANLVTDNLSYEAASVSGQTSRHHIKVAAKRFDSFLHEQSIHTIGLLKANIEGAERYLMETLSPELLKMVRNVAIACHDFRYHKEGNDFYKTKELVTEYFKMNGFTVHSRHTGVDYLDDWVYGSRNINPVD